MAGQWREEPVVVVAHDPAWAVQAEGLRARLLGAAGDLLVDVAHVGSTSVPGLAAKPVIDLLGTVATLDVGEALAERLRPLDWRYVPELEDVLPMRRFYTSPVDGPRAAHLHVAERGGAFAADHLAFRDLLRGDHGLADAYAALKHDLAARHRDDRDAYTDAKTDFITAALERRPADRCEPCSYTEH